MPKMATAISVLCGRTVLGGRLRPLSEWWRKRVINRKKEVEIDGCTFSLKNPLINQGHKVSLFSGAYEDTEREALKRFLNPALPVVELGGALGVVSCLTNKRLNSPSRHVVVEANPMLLPLLQENRRRNACEFQVLNAAVAYGAPRVEFSIYMHQFLGSNALDQKSKIVAQQAELEADTWQVQRVNVEAVTLESVLNRYNFPRCTLICDIEGAEESLLKNEAAVLRDRVDLILMEVHDFWLGPEVARGIVEQIKTLGFEEVHERDGTHAFQKKR